MWIIHRELKWLTVALILSSAFCLPAFASLQAEGRWVAGPCEIVAAEGNHVFFNAGSTLFIADITDPAHPLYRGEFFFRDSPTDIQVSGGILYVPLGRAGLKVLDVSDPTSPFEIGELAATESAARIIVHGNTAYLYDGGMRILDVSDPSSPREVGFREAGWSGFAIEGSQLYLVNGSVGLSIYDISNPVSPEPLGEFLPNSSPRFRDIVVMDHRAFVCANDNALYGIDVSNPGEPFYFISELRYDFGWAQRLGLVDGNLWVVGRAGLTVFEVEEPSAMPLTIEYFAPLTEGRAIVTGDGMGFIAEFQKGLAVFESSASGAPVRVGELDTRGIVQDVSPFGSVACLAMGDRGLHLVDYSDPGNPIAISGLESLQADKVHVSGHYAYVLGGDLSIVDISQPENPSVLSRVPFPNAEYVEVQDGFAYMSGGSYPLMIADVSDPANPFEVYSSPWTYKVSHRGMAVVDGFTFVSAQPWHWYASIAITDVSDPAAPVISGSVAETGASYILARGDDLILVDWGLKVLDVSTPELPVPLGALEIERCNGELAISGNTAYISTGGVLAVDISDYSRMEIRDYYDSGAGSVAVAVSGDIVLLADTDEGLILLRDSDLDLLEVTIDVKPGSDENPVNCRNRNSMIPVAILSDEGFDALTVDHTTVRFGPAEAAEAHENRHGTIRHEKDVDGDGDLDLVFHFRSGETGIQVGDNSAVLSGETYDGLRVTGTDEIQTGWSGEAEPFADRPIRVTPNPFNAQTNIVFYAEEAQMVRVAVYDMRGRRVAELTHRQYQIGNHSVAWRGRDASGRAVPSGEYFFRIEMGGNIVTRKAMLLK